MSVLQAIMAKVDHIPAIPAVVEQVLSIVQDPDFSLSHLIKTVNMDPGVTANVLRMCNSPYFGLRQEVSSLQQALLLMGSEQLMEIVMSGELLGVLEKDLEGYGLARGQLWRHSMMVALLAKQLAMRAGAGDMPTVFTAALLHDIGKIVLAEFVQPVFQRIEDLVARGLSLAEAERILLGLDHGELGGAMAGKWNFPPGIIEAITYHHAPALAPRHKGLICLVGLANLLCGGLEAGQTAESLADQAPPAFLRGAGLKQEELGELLGDFTQTIEQAGDMLSLAQ